MSSILLLFRHGGAQSLSQMPPEVAGLKYMLLACPSFVAIMNEGSIHYPSASLGDSENPDGIPLVVIEPSEDSSRIIAPAIVLPQGKLQVLLYMNSDNGASIEKTARAIKDELAVQPVGLPITGIRVGMASDPDGDSRAAQQFADENGTGRTAALRCIAIVVTYAIT